MVWCQARPKTIWLDIHHIPLFFPIAKITNRQKLVVIIIFLFYLSTIGVLELIEGGNDDDDNDVNPPSHFSFFFFPFFSSLGSHTHPHHLRLYFH